VALLGLQSFGLTENHLQFTPALCDHSAAAELVARVPIDIAESDSVIVPDHGREILARVWPVKVDECRLAAGVCA
jgi:hypothetical protein